MTIGKRIRKRRIQLGLTQQELASAVGFTYQYISAIEKDKHFPSIEALPILARELGISIDFLVSGEEFKESTSIGIIPAIKADKKMSNKIKKILISVVEAFYEASLPK